jgi:hypothetical protein
MDKSDLFWGMYQEHTTQGRHHEAQRTSANTIIAAVAGGVVALIGNKDITVAKGPLAAFLIALGLFGVIFTLKQTERSKFHIRMAKEYREELNYIVNLGQVRRKAGKDYGLSSLSGLGLWVVWMSLDIFIAVLGVLLLILSLTRQAGQQI